jgi:hypothetical protein
MIASVHLADVSLGTLFSVLRRDPDPARVPGLRSGRVGLATPLRTGPIPKLSRRVGLVAFWDDEGALDDFEATDPLAAAFAGGFRMRLAPLRAHGSWPGLDADVPKARRVDYDGPAAVLTLGRMRISQAIRFLRTSAKAEAATAHAPGLLWSTALARPPFVSTCSLWESSDAIARYAFDDAAAPHPGAITAGRTKPFHHQEAFIRFRPVASAGSLAGSNPLAAGIRL